MCWAHVRLAYCLRVCAMLTGAVFRWFFSQNRLREQLWGAGFLGGFTTVSGFAWDVASALQDQAFERVAVLFTADAIVGIAAAAMGYSITMARRQLRERKGAA